MKIITSDDLMQKGYTYSLQRPIGKEFDIDFTPELTPQQMLELGIFGGNYFPVIFKEYPSKWFNNAKLSTTGKKDPSLNYFKISASKPYDYWLKKGWINLEHDPRGWFQWYCRYYMGRRIPREDERQIKRWRAFRRHIGQIKKNCMKNDIHCRPRQRQALLHWAYDSRTI